MTMGVPPSRDIEGNKKGHGFPLNHDSALEGKSSIDVHYVNLKIHPGGLIM